MMGAPVLSSDAHFLILLIASSCLTNLIPSVKLDQELTYA